MSHVIGAILQLSSEQFSVSFKRRQEDTVLSWCSMQQHHFPSVLWCSLDFSSSVSKAFPVVAVAKSPPTTAPIGPPTAMPIKNPPPPAPAAPRRVLLSTTYSVVVVVAPTVQSIMFPWASPDLPLILAPSALASLAA